MKIRLDLDYVVRDIYKRDQSDVVNGVLSSDRKVPAWLREPAQISDYLIRLAIDAKYAYAKDDKERMGAKDSIRRLNARILNAVGRGIKHLRPLAPYDPDVEDVPQPASADLSREALEHLRDTLADWRQCPTEHQGWLDDLIEHAESVLKGDADSNGAQVSAAKPEKAKA